MIVVPLSTPETERLSRLLSKLRRRHDTYKSHEAARRSFYKFVCKEGLYTNLEPYRTWDGRIIQGYFRRPPCFNPYNTGFFPNGYPVFDWHRSLTQKRWEWQFDEHRKQWETKRKELFERLYQAFENANMAQDNRLKTKLRILNASGHLLKKVDRQPNSANR